MYPGGRTQGVLSGPAADSRPMVVSLLASTTLTHLVALPFRIQAPQPSVQFPLLQLHQRKGSGRSNKLKNEEKIIKLDRIA